MNEYCTTPTGFDVIAHGETMGMRNPRPTTPTGFDVIAQGETLGIRYTHPQNPERVR